MKLTRLIMLALVAALLAGPARADEETNVWKEMHAKADSVISIKYVMNIQGNFRGQSIDQERPREVRGILIDETGMILTSNSFFDAMSAMRGVPAQVRSEIQIKSIPTDIRVLFGNEEDEYEAQLVARDSNLGLAFLQILDLKDRKVQSVDLNNSADPAVGQTVYGVSRMERGFDCAPIVGDLFVSASVEKPRRMFAVSGAFQAFGHPLFDAQGRVLGVLSPQAGSEGAELGGGSRPFIIPCSTIVRPLKAAKERAVEALAEAKEAAAKEAEAEAEKEGEAGSEGEAEGEKKEGDAEKESGDGEK